MGLNELKQAIERLHGCSVSHADSSDVEEVFQGQTVWNGRVEIFDLTGHPEAHRCYAWEHRTDNGTTRYQTALELLLVDLPESAIRVVIVAEFKDAKAA